jgi:Zn-finger nucleic acid-binding protein
MDTHPYYGPGNVVIDNCGRCGLVWLDFGELDRIISAAGRDRGYLL